MQIFLRQIIFFFIGTLLRWPLWLLIGLIGRSGIFKTVFLVYPTDEVECRGFCPNISFLRRFFSGRPTPGGLIMNGWMPMGIYFVIPDLTRDLARKKNRALAETIVRRMLWIRQLSGAQTIGLAGQLGPIFARRHNIPMEPPLFSSINGNIFSIHEAINWVTRQKQSFFHARNVAVVGGGELGCTLLEYLNNQGYHCNTVDVRYTRQGKVVPLQSDENMGNLHDVNFVINLMPKGDDFLDSNLHKFISHDAVIIDFSRPAIPENILPQEIYFGNRIRRTDMRFIFALPGGWKQRQLPACALPALLTALTGQVKSQLESFCLLARQNAFGTALVDAPLDYKDKANSFWSKDLELEDELTLETMSLLSNE
ncbi:MAG: hypothetical protein KKD01_11330 [Proteobacteria bacterium]|nr:hypothetical protein [Pseudomonadota bacterium]MBU1417355.1 hypothetical protein [Pseudomonadota bacterium]MBU1455308.1 hypothetical protein [Pseudomonadota bacterium]